MSEKLMKIAVTFQNTFSLKFTVDFKMVLGRRKKLKKEKIEKKEMKEKKNHGKLVI